MKVLVIDTDGEGMGVDISYRAHLAEHQVKYWLPTNRNGEELPYGKGLVPRVKDWESSMDWADLVITTGNSSYGDKLSRYFGKGYPIFGTNQRSAALELDRGLGQEVLKEHGIKTIPYKVVTSVEEGIKYIAKTGCGYAMKPWGGDADKAMTCVEKDPDFAIFTLERWKKQGKFKGQLMMQQLVEGVEMGISGMFGPGGWCAALEESFEHKKFMNDDLGENTGEMGTVIRHTLKSKLFNEVLEPLTDYFHMCNYVGDASLNCIIDKKGTPWPLEFTMRTGWPDFCIRQGLIKGDPVEWMLALVEGRDEYDVSNKVGVGVIFAHGDFPKHHDPVGHWADIPVKGTDNKNVSLQQMQVGEIPFLIGGVIKRARINVSAGNYLGVAHGYGSTIKTAQIASNAVLRDVSAPSNVMYRTDIGDRLREQLPLIQKHGFAGGLKYE